MTGELRQKIQEEFIVLRRKVNDNIKLSQLLKVDFVEAKEVISLLRISHDNGEIEAKRTLLLKIFEILDDAIYRMITPGKLSEAIKTANTLVFLSIINIKVVLLAHKQHRPAEKKEGFDYNIIELKDIIKQLPNLIKKYPETIRSVHLIANLLKKYKTLSLSMEEKLMVAPEKTRNSIRVTYEQDLAGILLSIKKQYINMADTIPALQKQIDKKVDNAHIEDSDYNFDKYAIDSLKPIMLKQLAEFSKIRSCFKYIKDEGVDVLSIVTSLYQQKKQFLQLLASEEAAVFKVLNENNINVSKFNIFINQFTERMTHVIQEKFIDPYSRR